jgi:hypothetical protein
MMLTAVLVRAHFDWRSSSDRGDEARLASPEIITDCHNRAPDEPSRIRILFSAVAATRSSCRRRSCRHPIHRQEPRRLTSSKVEHAPFDLPGRAVEDRGHAWYDERATASSAARLHRAASGTILGPPSEFWRWSAPVRASLRIPVLNSSTRSFEPTQ